MSDQDFVQNYLDNLGSLLPKLDAGKLAQAIGWMRKARDEYDRLFTHLRIRDDQPVLYGFPDSAALELFQVLLAVSGVGPRISLALISSLQVRVTMGVSHRQFISPIGPGRPAQA